MAHIRPNHPVGIFTDKSRPEAANDRLVVLRWKSNEAKGRKAFDSRCFSVPMWQPELAGKDESFLEMLVDAFEKRQTKIAHTYVTERLTSEGICNDIPASLLSPEQVLADFVMEGESDSTRGKLSGDAIGIWYLEKLSHLVMMKVADNNGWMAEGYQMTASDEKKLQQASNGYKALLERLAAPTPKVSVPLAEGLMKAIALLGEDGEKDVVSKKLTKKLESILNADGNEEELLSLL